MITGTSCPHPLYRITGVSPHQHAATDDFAEALAAPLTGCSGRDPHVGDRGCVHPAAGRGYGTAMEP
jgi:hypothetical protein